MDETEKTAGQPQSPAEESSTAGPAPAAESAESARKEPEPAAAKPPAGARSKAKASHAAPPGTKVPPKKKENVYQAEHLGSGTFKITKPKRAKAKRRQAALKNRRRGSRK
ncbi:MAG TPA: hypothetical protein VLX58_13815 [Bryobacteraceae bacterium]|nr:hypothetical protein [Bryobacteraceae bacterium]